MLSRAFSFVRQKSYALMNQVRVRSKLEIPSKSSIALNTAVCVGFCAFGDIIAQVSRHATYFLMILTSKVSLQADKFYHLGPSAVFEQYDIKRTLHMACASAFMGPWFAWWYPYLATNVASLWSRFGLELLTGK